MSCSVVSDVQNTQSPLLSLILNVIITMSHSFNANYNETINTWLQYLVLNDVRLISSFRVPCSMLLKSIIQGLGGTSNV
jgi:hypothetical protein